MSAAAALLLAAGHGSRLGHLADLWPKCLMPIGDRPLMDYWLHGLMASGISPIFVNTHKHADIVETYLRREVFKGNVRAFREEILLGTGGTIRALAPELPEGTLLLAHADNFLTFDLNAFLEAHASRPEMCVMTMMTFDSPTPETCGIVELDSNRVVKEIVEKPKEPRGNLANGAVYLIEGEVVDIIRQNDSLDDFSSEILPLLVGRIYTWHNVSTHRDIGQIGQLRAAQFDSLPHIDVRDDSWLSWFRASEQVRAIQKEVLT